MSLKFNSKFKSILGCLLAVNLYFATPIMAAQDTTAATLEAVSATTDSAATATTALAADSSASQAADSTAVSEGTTTTASTGTPAVEEKKPIDPQVFKNFYYYILGFLLICTIVAIIGKVLSVYELTRKMNGKYNPLANNTLQAVLLIVFMVVFFIGIYYSYDVWGRWSWRDAVTAHGKDIDQMFVVTLVITTAVLILTHLVLLTFPYIYRMRKNRVAYFYPHNDAIERIWTIVPAIVLTVLVLFGFFTWRSITNVPEDLQKSALQVEVMGEQFMWTVRYAGTDGKIGKRNYKLTTATNPYGIDFNDKSSWDDIKGEDIVLPVNKSVRFHIISKDIIHSFYIPDFRVQINAVPGMTNYFQFTPTVTTEEMRDKMNDPQYDYIMLCNKICGSSHYNMGKKVVVVTEAEYQEWLSTQNKFFTEDLQKEFASSTTTGTEEVNQTASLN